MKKMILAAAVALIGSSAMADGFVCENYDGNLRIKVYHQTQPEMGTRNAAIMIVSDPTIGSGRKTIATFAADNALLSSHSALYDANVDLRFKNSSRKGENIGGTKLGEVDHIKLDVDYSFNNPVPAGETVFAKLTLELRNGTNSRLDMTCTRYLKGE
ncbi:MAG: hypothetical protein ACXVA9_01645 [Bdellovibrionales bacterium]